MGARNKGKHARGGELLPYREGGPGHRGQDTSIAGARKIARHTRDWHRRIMTVLESAGDRGLTSDEIAVELGEEKYPIRPRTSELQLRGWIRDSGRRRDGHSGIPIRVWVVVPEDQRPVRDRAAGTRPSQAEAA